MKTIIGIDASRNRSGGAVAHMHGILQGFEPNRYSIDKVHLWAYDELLDSIPNEKWLIKHKFAFENSNILVQLIWQKYILPGQLRKHAIKLLFNTDAGSVCRFTPNITLSQDMLSFEPGEIKRYSIWSFQRLRLEILKVVQLKSLKNANTAVFLSKHAQKVISGFYQPKSSVIIPHGINKSFDCRPKTSIKKEWQPRIIYVGNTELYKHQWVVLSAVHKLRTKFGINANITFVGGGKGVSRRIFDDALEKYDKDNEFTTFIDFVPNYKLPEIIKQHDIFLFASSCENLPITLLEGMASGLPIFSSDRGPMPDILGESAYYFNPESSDSIAETLGAAIANQPELQKKAMLSYSLSHQYTWETCQKNTWEVISKICQNENL